jgi:hypothetical protein
VVFDDALVYISGLPMELNAIEKRTRTGGAFPASTRKHSNLPRIWDARNSICTRRARWDLIEPGVYNCDRPPAFRARIYPPIPLHRVSRL